MCGIAGIWNRDGLAVAAQAIDAMNHVQRHRGPDGEGRHLQGDVALGHRRLSIVDLSAQASQPFWLPDRSIALVYNGEIHNYVELAAELRTAGVQLRTRSDTEVALWAYRLWGEECFERFNGMWAMAFWQPLESRLLLSRDRFGVKPLVYSIRGSRVAFASEPKAITAAFPEERRADHGMLRDLLAGGVPDADGSTFFENIESVEPGSLLELHRDRSAHRSYWRFEPGTEQPRPQAAEELRALLSDAVRIRLRSDVPVGVALSGGLDSSTVARLVAQNSTAPVHCFSIRNSRAAIDESRYASQVADDPLRYVMHWITPPEDRLLDTAKRLVWHHDAPMPIRGRFPQWHLMREAASSVKVMLDGQGADELLGGYARFVLPYALDRLGVRLPQIASRWALPGELRDLGRVTKGVHRLVPRLLLSRFCAAYFRRRHLAERRGAGCAPGPLHAQRYIGDWHVPGVERPFASHLNNALWYEFRRAGLPELLHAEDASSMAFSIESRLPFLDHRIVELCFSLPFSAKISAGWSKLLLRRAAAELVPESVCWRRHKLGFPADYAAILAGPQGFEELRAVLLDRRCLERGFVNANWLQRRLGGPSGQARRWLNRNLQCAWNLLTLELWCESFLDGEQAAPA